MNISPLAFALLVAPPSAAGAKITSSEARVCIYYASWDGHTESAAKHLVTASGVEATNIQEGGRKAPPFVEDFGDCDSIMVGSPTYNTGGADHRSETAWDDWLYDVLPTLDLGGKKVAVFCTGEQKHYDEYYCDVAGELYDKFEEAGCNLMGFTSTDGYSYTKSKAERDGQFIGQMFDQKSQADLTEERAKAWVEQLREEGFFEAEGGADTPDESNADTPAHGDVLQITEVSDKGSEGVCDEQDWLELWIDPIASPGGLDLSGFLLLTDDLEGNWTFPAGNQGRYPAGYSFICFQGDDPVAGPTTFSLGSNDVVIIKDTSGAIVATSPQRARWGAYGVVYARVSTDNENFVYTTTPTPGAENKITPLIRINEVSNGATEDTCNGRPWLEVNVLQGRGDRNSGPLDFTDVVLTNDQAGGSGNHVSFTFPAVEYREGYSVLCMMGEDPTTSPQFSITQGDTVSMLDPFGHTFSTIVYSHLESMSAGTSYSYNDKTGSFEDTTTPTPGEDNVFTKYAKTKSYLKKSLDMLAPVEI